MMDATARAWLPESALTLDAVRATLAPTLDRWATRWFVRDIADIAEVTRCAEAFAGRIELLADGKRLLIEAALATNEAPPTSANDERLLDALVDRISGDLLAQLGRAPAAGERGFAIVVALGGGPLLTLTLPEPDLVERVKAGRSPTIRERPRLTARTVAARGAAVAIEAVLGHGGLTLAELETIAVGDVVRLDRRLEEGITLRLAGSGQALAHGTLGRDGAMPAILL